MSDLAVRRLGGDPRQGPRLLALHGGPGLDHHTLLPLARRLAERFEVWLPDLPGHGGSLAPSGKLPGLAAVEDRLAAWLRRPDVVPEVLLGHSLGAWLARELVRRRRIAPPRALVLVAPPARGQPGPASAVRRAAAVTEDLVVEDGSGRDARREFEAHVEAETRGRATAEFLDAVRQTAVRPPWAYKALLRNLHRGLTGPLRPFDPGCPTLLVCGEDDRTTPPDQARQLADVIAGARLEVLADAGHYPFAERPDATARLVLAFLNEAL